MNSPNTDFVYKIEVDGTDIKEYYELEDCKTEEEVKELWLSDAEENHGTYLPEVIRENVEVTRLTDKPTALEE